MRFRRRRSLLPRIKVRRDGEAKQPLKGRLWTRSERALREPDVHWAWRVTAGVVAAAECSLLAWLWFGSALAVGNVQVVGANHMTAAQVAQGAGLAGGSSVLAVDGEAARQRLLAQTWVRTASVVPQLPGTVVIQISEWQPVAAFHSGTSAKVFLVSDQAVALGPATSVTGLVIVQGPSGPDPRIGDRVLDDQLLIALVNIQRGLPGLIGQAVSSFTVDSCGDLTLVSKRGWKVYFGRVLTPEEFSTLNDKLVALKAIAGGGNVNYNSLDLEYVNVMNPNEPAVGYKSREPATPSPSPGASPQPTPSPSPTPTCK
jgi:cell division septal protein FtsQ